MDVGLEGRPAAGIQYSRVVDYGAFRNWHIRLPERVNGPNGIAIDAADPNRLYLAAWGRQSTEGAVDGGIFLSTDGGKSWRNTLSADQHVYDISTDPRDGRTLYASGFESSSWRSTDRGETRRPATTSSGDTG